MERISQRPALENAPRPVPPELWGKDHWSTFGYVETRIVDHGGAINFSHMRCDVGRHPGYAHAGCSSEFGGGPYPTKLKGGAELKDHDDWDCLEDAERAGYIENTGTGVNPHYRMTEAGRPLAAKLRAHKQQGGSFANFEPVK